MDIRFVTEHGHLGMCLNGLHPLIAGSHVEEKAAVALGWSGKTKGFSERFLVLIILLAVARKQPQEVRRRFGIDCDDRGRIALLGLRKFAPFSRPKSLCNIKTDICNHFIRACGDKPPLLSLQSLSRGARDYDLLSLTCAADAIQLGSAEELFLWLEQYLDRSAGQAASSTRTPERAQPQPHWLSHSTFAQPGFTPRRPIENPCSFFGRSRELRTLLGWLSRTPMHNAAILGSRLAGKTSLLRQLCHICAGASLRADQHSELPAQLPHLRIVYVDFEIPHMLRQTGLFNHILTSLDVPVTSALRLDDFVEILAAAISSPTLLIFDNIGTSMRENANRHHEDSLSNVFWDCMRALVSNLTSGNLSFFVSAQETPERLAGRYQYSSSFFNIFRPLRLERLSHEEAGALLDSSPLPISPADRGFILQLCEGWPGLLQIAADCCLEAMRSPGDLATWRNIAEQEILELRRKAGCEGP